MNKHKTKKDIVKLFAAIIMMLVANTAYPQQQIIQIASRANSYCNSTCTQLDVPELNNNRIAVVIATPVIENGYVYPHPIGVHYINDKWSIINLDQASMPPGSKFTVQYFSKPDPDHQFVHIVNSENLTNNNTRSFIDHAGLNNNPEAQFQFISNGSGNGNNMYNIRIQYDSAAGKWYMYSIKKRSLDYNIAFNIILASKGNATVKPDVVQVKEGVKKDAKFSDSTKIIPSTKPNTEPVQPLVVLPAIIQGTPDNSLYGFVDMHTHPVSQLGFGEQLFYGDNDGDANVALGSCTCYHNFVALNCSQQNVYRNQMVDKIDEKFHLAKHNKVAAFPDFKEWPKYNSILHQQMWYEWIRRAKEGGLSVMVALAVNNHCIADAAETGGANDDLASMNKQLIAMKELFSRHPDFCEIAYTSADLRRIVKSGNLAVILGIEIDNIGNFYNPADHKGHSLHPYEIGRAHV